MNYFKDHVYLIKILNIKICIWILLAASKLQRKKNLFQVANPPTVDVLGKNRECKKNLVMNKHY